MEQNPQRGEIEEDEEEVERGSVGRLRGKEMLHNQLSRVFSCSPFVFTFFHFCLLFFLSDTGPFICQPYLCLPGCLALLVFLFFLLS